MSDWDPSFVQLIAENDGAEHEIKEKEGVYLIDFETNQTLLLKFWSVAGYTVKVCHKVAPDREEEEVLEFHSLGSATDQWVMRRFVLDTPKAIEAPKELEENELTQAHASVVPSIPTLKVSYHQLITHERSKRKLKTKAIWKDTVSVPKARFKDVALQKFISGVERGSENNDADDYEFIYDIAPSYSVSLRYSTSQYMKKEPLKALSTSGVLVPRRPTSVPTSPNRKTAPPPIRTCDQDENEDTAEEDNGFEASRSDRPATRKVPALSNNPKKRLHDGLRQDGSPKRPVEIIDET
mmetsp:Transcript_19635/g.34937  ORF Transcript_19635/g.34937 Transcript_19635/m.34937 type:complete len:295 (-) Transcript_19635:22-906(-)